MCIRQCCWYICQWICRKTLRRLALNLDVPIHIPDSDVPINLVVYYYNLENKYSKYEQMTNKEGASQPELCIYLPLLAPELEGGTIEMFLLQCSHAIF